MPNKAESQVTLDLRLRLIINESWGEDTTIAQVQRQAQKAADDVIRKALMGNAEILDCDTVNIFSKTEI